MGLLEDLKKERMVLRATDVRELSDLVCLFQK